MIAHFGTGFTYRLPGENVTSGCFCGDRRNCFGCETYEKYKQYAPPPATNFDRIHRMPVEELTEYIRVFFPEVCPPGNCPGEDYCYKCWLDWLKSPVEG